MNFTKKRVHGTIIEVYEKLEGWLDYKTLHEQCMIDHTDLRSLPLEATPVSKRPVTPEGSPLDKIFHMGLGK